jgi:hypothetical protein
VMVIMMMMMMIMMMVMVIMMMKVMMMMMTKARCHPYSTHQTLIKLLHKLFEFLCSLLMPYGLGLCVIRRTCR